MTGKRSKGTTTPLRYAIKMLGDIPDTILPDGWIGVYHFSGAIVYLHSQTRVVTWSRPYKIPKEASLKKHFIPLMSIPCLHQKRAMEKCFANSEEGKRSSGDDIIGPPAKTMRMESENDFEEELFVKSFDCNGRRHPQTSCSEINNIPVQGSNDTVPIDHDLPAEQVNEKNSLPENNLSSEIEQIACDTIDSSTEVVDMLDSNGIDSWKEIDMVGFDDIDTSTENDMIGSSTEDNLVDSSTEDDLVDCNVIDVASEIDDVDSNGADSLTDLDLIEFDDTTGISVSSLHEYVGKIFDFEFLTKEQFKYPVLSSDSLKTTEAVEKKLKLTTDGKTCFQILNEYCQKEMKTLPVLRKIDRQSQLAITVEILIENLKFGIARGTTLKQAKHSAAASTLNIFDHTVLNQEEPRSYLNVFDKMLIDDKLIIPTIKEFSVQDVLYPYDTLLHFLDRNFTPDFDESDIEFNAEYINSKREKYTMKYKVYEVRGECDGSQPIKQVASQAFIHQLYPQLKNWGSVIRLMEAHTNIIAIREKERKEFKETTVLKKDEKNKKKNKITTGTICRRLPLL